MLKVVETRGDVLLPWSYTDGLVNVVHACNAKGIMGGGLALQVKQRYPKAYQVYQQDHSELGRISFVKNVDQNLTIINAITQLNIGTHVRQTDYEAVACVFERIANVCMDKVGTKIAIPKYFGCGLGGGNWDIIKSIIVNTLKGCNATLYIVEYYQ